MTHPNEELVRRLYQSFADGDMTAFQAAMDPDVVWHSSGRSPVSGDHRGLEAVVAFIGKIMELSEGTFTATLRDVLANDNHAVALHNGRATSRGKSLDEINVLVIHFSNGRISEVWEHHYDLYAVDDYWS